MKYVGILISTAMIGFSATGAMAGDLGAECIDVVSADSTAPTTADEIEGGCTCSADAVSGDEALSAALAEMLTHAAHEDRMANADSALIDAIGACWAADL